MYKFINAQADEREQSWEEIRRLQVGVNAKEARLWDVYERQKQKDAKRVKQANEGLVTVQELALDRGRQLDKTIAEVLEVQKILEVEVEGRKKAEASLRTFTGETGSCVVCHFFHRHADKGLIALEKNNEKNGQVIEKLYAERKEVRKELKVRKDLNDKQEAALISLKKLQPEVENFRVMLKDMIPSRNTGIARKI